MPNPELKAQADRIATLAITTAQQAMKKGQTPAERVRAVHKALSEAIYRELMLMRPGPAQAAPAFEDDPVAVQRACFEIERGTNQAIGFVLARMLARQPQLGPPEVEEPTNV